MDEFEETPMEEEKEEKTPKYDDDEIVNLVDEKFEEAKDWRSQLTEQQWMINYAFYKGWHHMQYDKVAKRLVFSDKDPMRFYINLVLTTVRAVRNTITRDQPTFDVDSKPYGKLNPEDARVLGSYLNSLYYDLDMKSKVKEMVLYGMLYGIGICQYGYDANGDGGEGALWVEMCDPFDTYIGGPATTGMDDATYVIKIVKRDLQSVKENEHYKNTDELHADNKASESYFKELIVNKEKGADVEASFSSSSGSAGKNGTILLKEAWIKQKDGVYVATVAQNHVLRYEKTEFDGLPFILYQPDITPNELYGEGWVKNLIPLNRAINYLERKTLEFHGIMATGRYMTTPNSGVSMVTNENGQIIKVPRTEKFEQMDVKPMSSTVFNQLGNLRAYMEDVGAAQQAFLGRAPSGVTAGVAFETLVANNLNNLSDLKDNLEITLSKLGEQLLSIGYDKFNTTKSFKYRSANGKEEVLFVVGKDRYEKRSSKTVKLPDNTTVRVRIISDIAFTKGAKRDFMLALRANGDMDRRTVLEQSDFDADEIEARLFEEMQGMPVSKDGLNPRYPETFEKGDAAALGLDEQGNPIQAPQGGEMAPATEEEAMAMPPGEEGLEGGMGAQVGGVGDDQEMKAQIQELLMTLAEQGVALDPVFEDDPSLLVAVVTGEVQADIVDGIFTIVG